MKLSISTRTPSLVVWMSVIIIMAGTVLIFINYFSDSDLEFGLSIKETTKEDYWEQNEVEDGMVAGREAANYTTGPSPQLEVQAGKYDYFVGIDLDALELYWYENGRVSYTYPILSSKEHLKKLDIPDGQFRIRYQNERHLASAGDVYVPYIQQFYNNVSIHGWPSDTGGNQVLADYQNDGIRLSTRDAKHLYEMTAQDTPVIVSGEKIDTQTREEVSVPAPRMSASAYLIADIDTGEIIKHKQASRSFSIASITKLMTAVVARENNNSNESVYISRNAIQTYGNAGGLSTGERFTLETLFLPLLLDSSNDAATAIAEHNTYDTFIESMNQKARILGMRATHFDDPSGLSDENVSSGHDLLQLARYIWSYHRPIFNTTTEIMMTAPAPFSDGLRNFTNNNPVVGAKGYRGGKNGYTDRARHTLLSIFAVDTEVGTRNIIIIVLGSESRGDDTRTLLDWVRRTI